MIISMPHPQMIVMTADSRKQTISTPVDYETFEPIGEPTVEYSSMTKVFPVPGVGCVTLWGEVTRAERGFPAYLTTHVDEVSHVMDLRDLTERYLRDELRAEEDGQDIGFHVGGFMDRSPKLYHVFYGWDRPRPEGQEPDYRSYDSSDALALYNGRNDFVDSIVKLLVQLQSQVGVAVFEHDPVQRMILADFVTRYISAFTPDVGGEIHTVLITPANKLLHIRNAGGAIIPRDDLRQVVNDGWLEVE